MAADTEEIFAALFSLISSAQIPNTLPPFKTISRNWRSWNAVTQGMMPAMFQLQTSQDPERALMGFSKYRLHALIDIYLWRPTAIPDDQPFSTIINAYRDAVMNVLTPAMEGVGVTLGGLVTDCYPYGKIIIDEGILTEPAAIEIPIEIITAD